MDKYQILTLVISALSAVATFSAVLVALWQTKLANKKKLKLLLYEDNKVTALNLNPSVTYNVITLKITNIGSRDVIIGSKCFKIKKNTFTLFVNPQNLGSIENIVYENVMKTLEIKKDMCIDINFPRDEIVNSFKKDMKKILNY